MRLKKIKPILPFLLFSPFFIFSQIKEKNIDAVEIKAASKKLKKKENPAYEILQQVWKHKKRNGLAQFKDYQYDEYEKIEVDLVNIDSAFTKKKIFNKVDFIFKYADTIDNKLALPVYLNETFYKNYGKKDLVTKTKREPIANKASGFSKNEAVANTAKNLYKDINIYDDVLNFFNIGFTSPIARDGFSTYDYELLADQNYAGTDCYRIKYTPRKKDALAIYGIVYIAKENFAVVRATLKSSKNLNVNFVNNFYNELDFDNPNDSIFLPKKNYQEIQMSILSKKEEAKSLVIKKNTNFSHYLFNQNLTDAVFDEKIKPLSSDALVKPDSFWEDKRQGDSLTTAEKNIYVMMDELNKVPKFKRAVKITETLSTGYYNISKALDIGDLYSTFGYNDVEGLRLRFGARTYFSPNDFWRAAFYTAYGFRDQQLKYGFEVRKMLNGNNRFILGIGTRRDILQLGAQLTTDEGIMTRSFASSGVLNSGNNFNLSSVNQTSAFASIDPFKNVTLRLDATYQNIKSANPTQFSLDYYQNNQKLSELNDSKLVMSITARPGAKFSQYGVDRYEHSTLAPTIILKYTKGLEGFFNSEFGYNKLQFYYSQPILMKNFGRLSLNLEAGKNFNTVPLALQNVIPGNQSYGLIPNTFSLLNYYEFVADQYVTFHAEHHFNGKLFSYIPLLNQLKLREVIFYRAALGSLTDASKNLNATNILLTAPSHTPYYEYGFGIENIGFGNLRLFRIDFNWRGNYLDQPNANKFGIKVGIQYNY